MDKTSFALEAFKNIQDLIKFVDQKSGAVLVVAGLVFTGYIEFVSGLTFSAIKNINFLSIMTFLTSLTTVTSLIVVIYITIFKVLKPRTAKHYPENEHSLFYYEHVLKAGNQIIIDQYESLNSDGMWKDIVYQQREISYILHEKTKQLGTSLTWLFISIISLFIFIFFSIQV